jgi:hypothetical protein
MSSTPTSDIIGCSTRAVSGSGKGGAGSCSYPIARCQGDGREGAPVDLYTFLERLPKTHLHVHLAGTVRPSALVELARKNGVALPAYREPSDLYDYPDIYQFLCSVLLSGPVLVHGAQRRGHLTFVSSTDMTARAVWVST